MKEGETKKAKLFLKQRIKDRNHFNGNKNITKKSLGNKLNVNQVTLKKYEEGLPMQVVTFLNICEELGFTAKEMTTEKLNSNY